LVELGHEVEDDFEVRGKREFAFHEV
jgi:hypothetical protein